MYYYQVAIDVPLLQCFTYKSAHPIALGARVSVRFARRGLVAGVVWQEIAEKDVDYDLNKIVTVSAVLQDGFVFDEKWRQYMEFVAQYYHYPIGQTVASALPKDLSQSKDFVIKSPMAIYALNAVGQSQTLPKQAKKQVALWQALHDGSLSEAQAKLIHPQAKKILANWFDEGWLDRVETPTGRLIPSPYALNAEQNQAQAAIADALGRFQPFLLYGITGSGKTEVYFAAIAKALAQGKQVLFLLPEINLTPQLLKRVNERFENIDIAILHSQMPNGERSQSYVKALLGQAQLVIGTRLSVLTPLAKLGLVVVDEEHDGSFKQENELRYHARDLAIWRGKQASCPVVLGSATPSLETWHKANLGQYQLLRLPERAHAKAVLPIIQLDNIARQNLDHGFAPRAIKALQDNFQAGGLSLVYLNRRGFAPVLMCTDCGHSFACSHCSAKMVLHQSVGQLRCHHCDYHEPIARSCPSCGNQDLSAVGHGTQRVEETLRQAMPQARVVRVDRDSTSRKNDWEKLYQQIHDRQIDILVGTQMLAKGHDFAQLNLVVVLDADGSLYSADYRAPERLFAELMQVSGRAGRADEKGKVIVQTRLPEHKVFQSLLSHDYEQFAAAELLEREQYEVMPFSHTIAIRADDEKLAVAMSLLKAAKAQIDIPEEVNVLGPAPMLMMRLAKRERAHLFIESKNRPALHRIAWQFAHYLTQLSPEYRHCRWAIDVDPQEV